MSSPTLRTSLLALVGSRLVVNTAQRFVYPFLPAIARGLGISLSQAGLLVSVRWAAGLATPLAVGVAGRHERRRLQAFSGLALFAVGAGVTAVTNIYAGALLGFALMGIGKPVFDIAAQSYVADRTPYERRARYMSVLEWTWAGGLLVGAPAAGWTIDRLDWTGPFWILAGLALLTIPVLWRVLERDVPPAAASNRMVLARQAIVLIAVVGLFSFAAEVIFVVFGAWLEGSFGLSLVALGGAGFVVGFAELGGEGATTVFTDRVGKERSVALGLVISIVGFGLLGIDPSQVWVGMLLVAVAFFGFEFTIVSAIPLASEVAPSSRARYLALFIVAMSLGRAAGAATGPLLFDAFGLIGNSLAAAGVDLIALAIILRMQRAR